MPGRPWRSLANLADSLTPSSEETLTNSDRPIIISQMVVRAEFMAACKRRRSPVSNEYSDGVSKPDESTANLHITTAGHGYRSLQHVDHSRKKRFVLSSRQAADNKVVVMNLSHVITDFSFGPYFPDMAQPLKNTFELTHERTP